jgi:hypothetical protein
MGKKGLWRLYDSKEKAFFNDLTLEQLQRFIDTISKHRREHWHVAKDDGEDWFPLSQVIDKLPAKVETRTATEELDVVTLRSFLKTSPGIKPSKTLKDAPEKRKMKRIEKRIQVYIDVGERVLTAYTRNISIIAIKLDTKFPIKYAHRSYLVILASKPSLQLRCTPMASEAETLKGYWSKLKINPTFNLKELTELLEK